MHKVIGYTSLALIVALSGCGGESDSSGASYKASYDVVLNNKNEYSCPSVDAKQQCTSDDTCHVAKCDLTKEVMPVVKEGNTSIKDCKVGKNFVTGYTNESCQFKNTLIDADIKITCQGTHMVLDGHIEDYIASNKKVVSGTNINAYWIKCP